MRVTDRIVLPLAALLGGVGPMSAVRADSLPTPADRSGSVAVELRESVPAGKELELGGAPGERYTEPAFAFPRLPTKYSPNGLPLDRGISCVLQASAAETLPPGTYELRLRARGAARLYLDDRELLTTQPQKANSSGDDPVPPPPPKTDSPLRPAFYPHQDAIAKVTLDGHSHQFVLLAVIGGKGLYPTPGELSVSYAHPGEVPRLLGGPDAPLLTDAGWEAYVAQEAVRHQTDDTTHRHLAGAGTAREWEERHRQVREWLAKQPALPSPPAGKGTPVDRYLDARLLAAKRQPTAPLTDLEFLRRLSLDTVGTIPTPAEIRRFLVDPPATRRRRAVDRLLASPGWADHWVGYWQDVLAENPGILKPDLNNTGPFRWWLRQCFADNVPFDRMVTELVEMEGSAALGAPAGFGQATLNDAPMAAKGHVLAGAFLAQNLSCARCHDAPAHPFKQRELFSLAAMLEGKPVMVPATSTVKVVAGFRKPKVNVTIHPGEPITPAWPFTSLVGQEPSIGVPAHARIASRDRLAAMIVAPEDERFAEVIVNRMWQRYMGAGIVEPVDDWFVGQPSHPELLRYLARELLRSGYDLKHVARLILSSQAYGRRPAAERPATTEERNFAGPYRRRMTAEQLVDSLHRGVGKQIASEALNLNPAGDRPANQFLDLGAPCRAWQFTALSNERDRPALALPLAQATVDVLTAFGWRQSRQNPTSVRDDAPSPGQTLVLANGIMGTRIVRLSDDSAFTELCLEDRPLAGLVRETFLRLLSRPPSARESAGTVAYLKAFYANRRVPGAVKRSYTLKSDSRVSWSNHLSAEATVIRMAEERRLRLGDEPTRRLTPQFRERFEDVVWALVNSPEFVMVP